MIDGLLKISREILQDSFFNGIEIYDIKLSKFHNDYHILVQLDNIHHTYGSVTLDLCEKFSNNFIEILDRKLLEDKLKHQLPIDLNIDNYTLEVSSAGAERELRLPEELYRFKGLPLKITYKVKDTRDEANGKDKKKEMIVTFLKKEGDTISFLEYLTKEKKRKLKKQKIENKNELKTFEIKVNDLLKANLYLEI